MDELEVLKEKWQAREQEFPKLSYGDIYNMLLRKSSSIVKWIFIISICELLFWIGMIFILPDSYQELTEGMGINGFIFYSNILHFLIFGVFIYLFYKNYMSIKVTDSTKNLMRSILRTRKTVRYFVYYNIGMFIVSSIILNFIYYANSEELYVLMGSPNTNGINADNFATIFIVLQVIVGIVFVAILALFYWLIYGILLRRLKRNYKELKTMDG